MKRQIIVTVYGTGTVTAPVRGEQFLRATVHSTVRYRYGLTYRYGTNIASNSPGVWKMSFGGKI
jgi:hypothetical protein